MIWDPQPYSWPQGYKSAACFTVDVDATAPYRWQHRDQTPNTLAALEHRRFGMRRGLARMVAMLQRVGMRGTFFVPACVAQDNPDLLTGLLERGQEIALHGYFHELVNDISDTEFTDALEQSIDLFIAQTGQKPVGFRSPAWEMTPHMLSELARLDLWDSSLMGEDVPYEIANVPEIPVRWDNDDAIFFKFLGAGDKTPRPDFEVARQWQDEAQALFDENALFMLTVHDWISGRANRVKMLENLLTSFVSRPDVWVASCGEIAAHHKAQKTMLRVSADLAQPIGHKGLE